MKKAQDQFYKNKTGFGPFLNYDNAIGIDRDVDKTTNKIKDKENLYKTGFGHVFLKVWGDDWLLNLF